MYSLLVINPNTTVTVTELVAEHVRKAAGSHAEIVAVTGRFGCAYISSESCYTIAAHAALDCYAAQLKKHDGVLLACFGDPGLVSLRDMSPVPVTGLAEACMLEAAARLKSFSIVTGGVQWKPMLERLASEIGLRPALASVRAISLTGGQIAEDPDGSLEKLLAECNAAADEDGAQEVILGGAGLAGLAEKIQSRCRIPIRDSVLVGTQVALERMRNFIPSPKPGEHRFQTVGLSPELTGLMARY